MKGLESKNKKPKRTKPQRISILFGYTLFLSWFLSRLKYTGRFKSGPGFNDPTFD